jgi:sterol 3beta-glucosyltransferase
MHYLNINIVKSYNTVLDFVKEKERHDMITILCAGSRGDFQPYIALAQQLKALGKAVRIVGNRSFASFVQHYGIEYVAINADIETLNVDPKLLRAAGNADNPFKMILAFNKMKEYGIYVVSDYFAACTGSELIIYHPGCTIGYFVAQLYGIPAVLASPFPMHRTQHHLSVVLYGQVPTNRITTALSYTMIQSMLWLTAKDSIKQFWQGRFGQAPADFGMPFERHNHAGHPAVISCSNHVFARPTDWNPHIHQHGYWFVTEHDTYTPSPELAQFLDHPEAPIYVGFGSMTALNAYPGLRELVVAAIVQSGKRAIIHGLGDQHHLPESIMAIDAVPHTWLFPRMAAVCHHGGAGTTAAGLSAGVPNIVVPFANDQFAWGHRVHDLGVGPAPIPRKKLTVANLAGAIAQTAQPRMQHAATQLGQRIAQESGAYQCAQVIAAIPTTTQASR